MLQSMTPHLEQQGTMMQSSSSFNRILRRSSLFSSWVEDAQRRSKKLNSIAAQHECPEDSPGKAESLVDVHEGRRQSSFSISPLTIPSTIVFVDLEGYSKASDLHQKYITRDFMATLRDILTFAYGSIPNRSKVEDYVILPTGDGAAVCVMRPPKHCQGYDSPSLQGTEDTALWIGAELLFYVWD
jgi:hypothetical protein